MKGKYIFWSIFIIGCIISIISLVAIFLPNESQELYDAISFQAMCSDIFFLAADSLVLMLAGKRVKEFIEEDREFKISLLSMTHIYIVLHSSWLAFRSLYRLIFMLPI